MTVTAHQISNAADVTYRVIDHWTRAGYLTPAVRRLSPGIPRLYPDDQIRRARHLAALTRAGFTARGAYLTALALEQDGVAELGPYTLRPAHPGDGSTHINPTGDTAA